MLRKANETADIMSQGNDEVNTREVWTLHRKLLWAVLATRRVVFIGFSMEDPYFDNMLETVSALTCGDGINLFTSQL